LGLIIIVFFSIRGRLNENENVIYVEKYIDRKNQQERLNENGSIFYQQNNQEDLKNKLIEIKEKLINSPTKTDEEQFKWLISTLCNTLQASVAAVFLSKEEENVKYIEFLVGYAFQQPESNRLRYEYGEGIAGQVAKEGKEINITSVPQDYIQIVSGLGKATPNHMLVVPIKVENEVKGVVEIASFTSFSEIHLNFIKEALDLIAKYHFTTFVV
jgi:putative methionine-R-sulfoxide reductase with GAF domain